MGATRLMVGNATTNAKAHAFNQTNRIFSIKPTLKSVMTKDIIHDINNAMKNEKTSFWNLAEIINTLPLIKEKESQI